ncbi:MAG TPA: S9 family peptidase [Phycisphaerae bacterium]|nr:S9 family peptidase [Phycisphaerae bacterium]
MLSRILGIALTLALISAAAAFAEPRAAKDAQPGKLIPRGLLFGNPDRASPEISPDGTRLAYLADVDGVMNVWVGPIDKPDAARPVTKDTKRGIRQYNWCFNSDYILYIQDKGGDENWHVYATNVKTNKTTDLTPIDGIQARIDSVSPKFPNEVLLSINDRDKQLHDVYRVNIETGEKKLIEKNEGYVGFAGDRDFNLRVAMKMGPDGGMEMYKRDGDAWKLWEKIPSEDNLTTQPVGFDKTGKTLYLIDSRQRNTAGLFAVDLASGRKQLLASDDRADAESAMIHPTEETVQAVTFNYDRRNHQILDHSIDADMKYLESVCNGEMDVTSRTLDDKSWIVTYVTDDGPVKYYLYNRPSKKATFLFTNRSKLEGQPLAKMHPVIIKARDGLNLVSYLSLPTWSDPKQTGVPTSPLPMVLFVHGGPWARDNWSFNPYHQWLANRGYAVLSVNYRGSTGLGKNFANAGNKEWAGKMHDDLIDSVKWAIDNKVADSKKVGIMGGSYGGYATLVGLTFTPETFACGVDIVGPSNIVTLLNSIPPYWAPMIDMFTTRVGDHRTEDGRKFLESRSPLTRVDKIVRPLLIGQGANDPRVKQAEADQIVKAMKERNIPVTYVLYPDEGHGFARPENRTSFNAITEAFLSQHLGGRYEPIGGDFKGSSVTVPEGADHVPGLTSSLAKSDSATN